MNTDTKFKPCGTPTINRDWVATNFGITFTGDEAAVCCPIHGDKRPSMRINIAKGLWFCHSCGARGRITSLARQMGVSYAGTSLNGVDLAVLQSKLNMLTKHRAQPAPRILPETYLKRFDFPSQYWSERGLTEDTVSAFDLGYDPLSGAVTIPIRDVCGNLLGVTRRFLNIGPDDTKYKDPKGFVKSKNLFGSWFVARDDSPTVVLTEGPLDAIKVWQAGHAALAQFGSNLSVEQIRLLRELGVITIVSFYDNDHAGRKAFKAASGWTKVLVKGKPSYEYRPECDLSRFFIVRRVRYDVNTKDPGGMSDTDIDRLVRNASYLDSQLKTPR